MSEPREPTPPLVDLGLDRPDPELLRQPERIYLVVLRTPSLPALNPRHDQLLDVRLEHLVQPPRQRALFQAYVPVAWDLLDHFDERPGVRLHHMRAQALSARTEHGQRAA